jgi:hypothetical protein
MTTAHRIFGMFLMTAMAAIAAPLYINGVPNTDSGNEMTSSIQAEDFTLNATTSLTGIRFWGFYFDDDTAGYLGQIAWWIQSDSANQPGAVLYSGLATPIQSAGASNCCDGTAAMLEFGLSGVTLSSGTYWLGLHNGPTSNTNLEHFYWQTTNANATASGMQQAAPFGPTAWESTGLEHAFELDGVVQPGDVGSVPEPSTFVLAGIALVACACRRAMDLNKH